MAPPKRHMRSTRLLDVFFPPTCGCGAVGLAPCARCVPTLVRSGAFSLDGLDSVRAVYRYEGPARDLVRAFKFSRQRSLVQWASTTMSELVESSSVQLVTWVPASADGRRLRGFDQGEVLARAIARRLDLRAVALLVRSGGDQQTGAARVQRLARSGFAVSAAAPRTLHRTPNVLVVDDIVTTGASMRSAADALRGVGAVHVHGCALARADRAV